MTLLEIDPHDPAVSAAELARHIDGLVRALNYATRPGDERLSTGPDAYSVIGAPAGGDGQAPPGLPPARGLHPSAATPRVSCARCRASHTRATRDGRCALPQRHWALPPRPAPRSGRRSARLSPRSAASPTKDLRTAGLPADGPTFAFAAASDDAGSRHRTMTRPAVYEDRRSPSRFGG